MGSEPSTSKYIIASTYNSNEKIIVFYEIMIEKDPSSNITHTKNSNSFVIMESEGNIDKITMTNFGGKLKLLYTEKIKSTIKIIDAQDIIFEENLSTSTPILRVAPSKILLDTKTLISGLKCYKNFCAFWNDAALIASFDPSSSNVTASIKPHQNYGSFTQVISVSLQQDIVLAKVREYKGMFFNEKVVVFRFGFIFSVLDSYDYYYRTTKYYDLKSFPDVHVELVFDSETYGNSSNGSNGERKDDPQTKILVLGGKTQD